MIGALVRMVAMVGVVVAAGLKGRDPIRKPKLTKFVAETQVVDDVLGIAQVQIWGPPSGFLAVGLGEGSFVRTMIIYSPEDTANKITMYELNGGTLALVNPNAHDAMIISETSNQEFMSFKFSASKVGRTKLNESDVFRGYSGTYKPPGFFQAPTFQVNLTEIVDYNIFEPPMFQFTTMPIEGSTDLHEVRVTGPPGHDYLAFGLRSDQDNPGPSLPNTTIVAFCPTCKKEILFVNNRSYKYTIEPNPEHDLEIVSAETNEQQMVLVFRASKLLSTKLARADSVHFACGPKDADGLLGYHKHSERRNVALIL